MTAKTAAERSGVSLRFREENETISRSNPI
jgi:hypothetical protein